MPHPNDPPSSSDKQDRLPQGDELGLIKPLFGHSDQLPKYLFQLGSAIDKVPVLQVQHQTSTLITGVSSLIPSSSRIPTILGHVVNLLAIPELYSTLPIVISFPLSLVVSILCYLAFLLFGSGLKDLPGHLEGTGSSVGWSAGSSLSSSELESAM
ncbi:hypothetical protein Tco_1500671 [Tanacetum coccineum]